MEFVEAEVVSQDLDVEVGEYMVVNQDVDVDVDVEHETQPIQ